MLHYLWDLYARWCLSSPPKDLVALSNLLATTQIAYNKNHKKVYNQFVL